MERIFALDIGTRKILGLVVEKDPTEEHYRVLASKMIPHSTRAMLDGQIHDVPAVAASIIKIKQALEQELGFPLTSAAVAAAGRALETRMGKARQDWTTICEINPEEVSALELAAVQRAQSSLQLDDTHSNYLCVGYSVVRYYLEEQEIGSLIGQLGTWASVDVIATFLPRVVVDSLLSALKKAELNLKSMTLEPIAALSIAIPANMRLLNLAMVDIGAGTSDIALVKAGNIFAYAMVPQGGDEVTEAISQKYLLDFNTAEALKCEMRDKEVAFYSDILGNEGELTREDFIWAAQPVCASMVQQIAENILQKNGKAPDAVILIGGGSLTPGLTEMLAESMGIGKNRVGIKNQVNESFLDCSDDHLYGPQSITPLGIAYESFLRNNLPLMKVIVNQREVTLWNSDGSDVAKALINTGIQLHQIYGRPGMGKTIEWNGELKVFPGTMGTQPLIRVNGQEASLSSLIADGDVIEFSPGKNGEDGVIELSEIADISPVGILVNGQLVEFLPSLWVNGTLYEKEEAILDRPGMEVNEEEIPDGAKVELKSTITLRNLLYLSGLDEKYLREYFLQYSLDGALQKITWSALTIQKNHAPAQLSDQAEPGDIITCQTRGLRPSLRELFPQAEVSRKIRVLVNQTSVLLPVTGVRFRKNGQLAGDDEIVENEDQISLEAGSNEVILSDIFNQYELHNEPGKRLIITVNGEEAGFVTPLRDADRVSLSWE